ncbi:MAG TPA: DNA internalization-related competence protein ComEC/Rec2 [Xanthomonadales bacterium]|nr:DNA internalization-related competence protein ComEC/Rec2 [Xanthomonadales bacterium]
MKGPARGIPAGLAAGALGATGLFVIDYPLWMLLALLMALVLIGRKPWMIAAACSFVSSSLLLQQQLDERLKPTLDGQTLMVEGSVEGLAEQYGSHIRFRFHPMQDRGANPATAQLPERLLVYWFRDPPELLPGSIWRLELVLRPPWGKVNFVGPDHERWLFAEGVGGLGTALSGHKLRDAQSGFPKWNQWRYSVRQKIQSSVEEEDLRGVVSALALADRSGMPDHQREALARTGTAHLLAISGLHIGLAALFGFWLARLALVLIPPRWTAGHAHALALVASVFAAMLYAALAGFGTSTVRALVMLIVGVALLGLKRSIHPLQALVIALVTVLMLNPLSPLGAGFWLSFTAVGVLLFLFSGSGGSQDAWWRQLINAQAGIMLVMLPLSAWWFGSGSPAGLIANLIAIPWVSVVTVPLVLLALLLLPVSDGLSSLLFSAAAQTAGWLLKALSVMASWPAASVSMAQPTAWLVLLASCGALMLLLPRGLCHRWLGLLLILPLFASARSPEPGALQLDVLDVGQGTALLIRTESNLLLYDSGPGDGDQISQVQQVIAPAVRQSGHASPDRIIISHGDLDHAGGLGELRVLYPDSQINASLPQGRLGLDDCDDGLSWSWGDVEFKVLHPSPFLPYQGNDSSCVLSIRSPVFSLLLPGDISVAAEQRLVRSGLKPNDVLLVPHHGSKSSSSIGFIGSLAPDVAIATAGSGNRFGFPRKEVTDRYAEKGVEVWSTNACGGIRLTISADGEQQASSARNIRTAPWRWPAAENCP